MFTKIKNLNRIINSSLLGVLILLQSCQVYDKGSVSLEEASQTELRARVITTEEAKTKYRQIILEDQQYFGLKKVNGNLVKFPLTEEDITSLRLQNKKKSTWATVGLGLSIPLALIIFSVIYCSTEGCINWQ